MTSIGNDIVDLCDEDCRNVLQNFRFMDRVFTAEEKMHIARSKSPESYLWSVWACKESAFKALRRAKPDTVFSPIKFATREDLDLVIHESAKIRCQVNIAQDVVFAFAVLNGEMDRVVSLWKEVDVSTVNANVLKESSALARKLLAATAEKILQSPTESFSVPSGNGRTPPVLMRGSIMISDAVSLTHHGRYAGASLYDPR